MQCESGSLIRVTLLKIQIQMRIRIQEVKIRPERTKKLTQSLQKKTLPVDFIFIIVP